MTEPYLFQTLHVAGRRPRLLREHLAALARCRAELFGRGFDADPAGVEERIVELLDRGRYPADRSAYVRMELSADGQLALRADEPALYRGYVLRALHPTAVCLPFELPFGGNPTAAAELAWLTARCMAEARGVHLAVRTDSEGILREADGAPLFIVRGRELLTAAEPASAEAGLAAEAIRQAGYRLRIEPFHRAELSRADELFYADHRGITALERCDGRALMAVIAARVARVMEELGSKM